MLKILSLCTSVALLLPNIADAGVVYDVSFNADGNEWFNGWSDYATVQETGVGDFSGSIWGEAGHVDIFGDQSGVALSWGATQQSEWNFTAVLGMTFDTATEVTIFWSDGWGSGGGGGYFITDPAIGTYLVEEGELFSSSTDFHATDFDTNGYLYISFNEVPAPGVMGLFVIFGVTSLHGRRRKADSPC